MHQRIDTPPQVLSEKMFEKGLPRGSSIFGGFRRFCSAQETQAPGHTFYPPHVSTYALSFLLEFKGQLLDLLSVQFKFRFELPHLFWVGTLDYCDLPRTR
jgi:hypothetical protein